MKAYLQILMIGLLSTGLTGCMVNGRPITDQPPRTGGVHDIQISGPKTVELSPPKSHFVDHVLTVWGTARKTVSNEKISGFIDVEILDQKNKVIDDALATLSPAALKENSSSKYKISLWTKNPRASKIKVVFIDQRDAADFYHGNMGGGAGAASYSGNYGSGRGGYGSGGGEFGRGITGIGGVGGLNGITGINH